ncbi:hypothetical protein CU311_06905 [Prochlorococcus marinus str. MU1402]|uniref:class I SAM-dependent methyltransferase n=1 Tax=Prochlorococcus marinus TaxID=1219 RepID=UPI001AD99714|nr:class I SAM-dependent methyltransferase [Prochlorococcus marinus]MBO8232408.1 class I SAM-dependent methyltransferase [Prochlorococcus marinus XMU1402]MBW3057136.1 hypothetical protein [Prochlorococcus marinus str. MU1402]
MFYKFKIILWYLLRPLFWEHSLELLKRKYIYIKKDESKQGLDWAKKNSNSLLNGFKKIGINCNQDILKLDINKELIDNGDKLIKSSLINIDPSVDSQKLAGKAYIKLLYILTLITDTKFVIETGVGYGWSSLAILLALSKKNQAKGLVSIDMPYPSSKSIGYVGKVIPDYLKQKWTLISLPDKPGIRVSIKKNLEKFDLAHYDSDKSIRGKEYGYELLWKGLRKGGILISDDIEDNLSFCRFIKKKEAKFTVIKKDKKYIGLVIKK